MASIQSNFVIKMDYDFDNKELQFLCLDFDGFYIQ